jgi:DnaJ-class molecular chaperone
MPEINIDTKSNVITLGQASFEAFFNRIIVLEDEYRSGYECPRCEGKDIRREISYVVCDGCDGRGTSAVVKEAVCKVCHGDGVMVCPDCKGKGAMIVVPDDATLRPTTGTVVSKGETAKHWELGDKVIFPSSVGHRYVIGGKTKDGREIKKAIIILRDEEVMCRMYGSLEQRAVKKSMALHTIE